MSKGGHYYNAANGTKIFNQGQAEIRGLTGEADKIGMTMQVAQVKTPLGSVRRMNQSGNRVVFDDEYSYIENKATRKRTTIEYDEEDNMFILTLWIKKQLAQGNLPNRTKTETKNGFAALTVTHEEDDDTLIECQDCLQHSTAGFHRRA